MKAVADTMVGGATLTKLHGHVGLVRSGRRVGHDGRGDPPRPEESRSVLVLTSKANTDSQDICIGVPAIIGRKGIEKIVKIDLSKEEAEKFAASADAVRKTNNVLHEIKAI